MMPSPFGGPGGGLFGLMFTVVPLLVIGGFIYVLVSGLSTWIRNNGRPVDTRPARVVSKRTHVWGGQGNSPAHTSYYATFEDEQGNRLELQVGARVYGETAEGDVGMLTSQGTRFHGFERDRQ